MRELQRVPCVLATWALLVAPAIAGTVTITKAGSGSGTVTSSVGAINCGLTCVDAIPNVTTITLTATPGAGSVFTGWLGPCTGDGACQFAVGDNATVQATFAAQPLATAALDVDGNTKCEPLIDGFIALRYLFGIAGAPLTDNAIASDATRKLPAQVYAFLTDVRPKLDVDGNGRADALTDGVLAVRYLLGLRDGPLIAGAIGNGATRSDPMAIETYVHALCVAPAPPGGSALTVRPFDANDVSIGPALKFAETARRNWSFEGHTVPDPFSTDQGYWNYEACTTHYAVWLFDRPTASFRMAELTGNASYRDLAISDFRYWVSKIDGSGYFSCKTGEQDTKYLYIEPFVLYEAATGDASYRPVADRVYGASANGFPVVYSTDMGLWTEREVGIHMDAALAYSTLTGNMQALARAAALVKMWTDMSGALGAPLVTYTQHEGGGPGGTQPQNLTNSPWMSAMYFQAARKYWQATNDAQVLNQASAYFDWLDANGFYDGSLVDSAFAGVTIPRYLTGDLIGDAGYDIGNIQHCPDVQGFVQFALTAKTRLGLSTARAQARLSELQICSQRMWAYWTRATLSLPKYRIQTPRAWSWWMRGIYEYSLR